jgi:hypothetical protein
MFTTLRDGKTINLLHDVLRGLLRLQYSTENKYYVRPIGTCT